MTDATTNLQFPLLAADQAQKHVTVNESLLRLDALVQLAPKSLSYTIEPPSPADGDIYILPAGKSGVHWGDMADWALVHYFDGVWEQITPRKGFVAFVQDTLALKYYDGATWLDLLGLTSPRASACSGRLSLETGVAASETDQAAKTVVYFTPDHGNDIALFDGATAWSVLTFSEVSIKLTDTQTGTTTNGSAIVTGLADTSQLIAGMEASGTGVPGGATIASVNSATQITLSANATASGAPSITFKVPADTNVDVFGYNNGGALKLELVKWSSATARATALAKQNGVHVKAGATTRRLLGTVRTTNVAGQTEDSLAKRFVWNAQNRRTRPMRVMEATDTWAYSTAAWRQANGSSANQLAFVRGLNEDGVTASVSVLVSSNGGSAQPVYVSIGLDSTAGIATGATSQQAQVMSGTNGAPVASYAGLPGLGHHVLTWLEYGAGSNTQTWYGDAGAAAFIQNGMAGAVLA